MKKSNLVILILLFFTNTVFAQEFAPLGAKWYFPRHHSWSAWMGVSIYESIGDTIINDKACKILYNEDDVFAGSTGHSYFHQSSDTIYKYNELTYDFDMIIDFGAMPGDTFLLDNLNNNFYIDTMYCIVDSISYLSVNVNDSLRVQNVRQVAIYDNGYNKDTFESNVEIIEKIGFAEALIPYELVIVGDNFWNGRIRCYEDSEVGLINFSDLDCLYTFIPTSTEEQEHKTKISVYPNPAEEYLFLEIPFKSNDWTYQIWDVYGKELITKKLSAAESDDLIKIGLTNLIPACYFIVVADESGEPLYSAKFLKQ